MSAFWMTGGLFPFWPPPRRDPPPRPRPVPSELALELAAEIGQPADRVQAALMILGSVDPLTAACVIRSLGSAGLRVDEVAHLCIGTAGLRRLRDSLDTLDGPVPRVDSDTGDET